MGSYHITTAFTRLAKTLQSAQNLSHFTLLASLIILYDHVVNTDPCASLLQPLFFCFFEFVVSASEFVEWFVTAMYNLLFPAARLPFLVCSSQYSSISPKLVERRLL